MTHIQHQFANNKFGCLSSIDIVIVNWNSGSLLSDCIKSIESFVHANVSIIVVDNASTDNSLDSIKSKSIPMEIIRNHKNIGFAAACNQGAAVGSGEFILFLNPDTRLQSNSLVAPLTFMSARENSNVGICGIQLIDDTGHVAKSCSRFPSCTSFFFQATGLSRLPCFQSQAQNMSDWDHSSSREVDQIIGAFFFVRRKLFECLQGFDERFFVYFEEVDFSLRAKRSGWQSYYMTEAQAIHIGGGTSHKVKAKRLFYSLRSRLLYGFKHFSWIKSFVLLAITLFIEPISRVLFSLFQGKISDTGNTVSGYISLFAELPQILRSAILKRKNKC